MRKLHGNPWAILVVVSLGFFMTLLDLTIVNIAIPNMIDKLHASLDDVLWVLNSYALVLAVLVITAGRLGDLIGQRVMFIIGVALFTAAWTDASSATSARANRPPVSLATRLPPSSFRSAMTTVAPAAASARAAASPSPLAPPEMIAAVPFTSMRGAYPARPGTPPAVRGFPVRPRADWPVRDISFHIDAGELGSDHEEAAR